MSTAATSDWRLVERQVKINGKERYLWQAVDAAGEVSTSINLHLAIARDREA